VVTVERFPFWATAATASSGAGSRNNTLISRRSDISAARAGGAWRQEGMGTAGMCQWQQQPENGRRYDTNARQAAGATSHQPKFGTRGSEPCSMAAATPPKRACLSRTEVPRPRIGGGRRQLQSRATGAIDNSKHTTCAAVPAARACGWQMRRSCRARPCIERRPFRHSKTRATSDHLLPASANRVTGVVFTCSRACHEHVHGSMGNYRPELRRCKGQAARRVRGGNFGW
jgi:hypothetical protein